MSLFAAIRRAFIGGISPDPLTLDNVPVGALDCRTPDRVAAARERYGKPFAGEIKQERQTEPSYVLEHINAQSEAAAKVTDIRTRRKK